MSDASVAALESALTRLIRRALLPTSGDETRAAAGVTLDRAAYHVLLRICDQGTVRLSALAEAMDLDVSTVSRHVTRLEHDGYVSRSPDPDDGRAARLDTTEAGRAVLERVRETRRARLQALLDDWDEGDVGQLAGLLDRLIATFDADRSRP